ncbi:hypothetical protein IAS59_004354 [Cryptococcus gattii]
MEPYFKCIAPLLRRAIFRTFPIVESLISDQYTVTAASLCTLVTELISCQYHRTSSLYLLAARMPIVHPFFNIS